MYIIKIQNEARRHRFHDPTECMLGKHNNKRLRGKLRPRKKKQSIANTGLQKPLAYLVHLLDHFGEFLVVLQELVELRHRVAAKLVGKTRHF